MKTFINLPVRDLAKTTEFFTGLGFSFDRQFTSDNTTSMIIGEEAYVMFHTEETFQGFTGVDITDTSTSREVIVGLSADSREQVDELIGRARESGGAVGEPIDQGFMYMCGFRDLDDHQWSFTYMNLSAIPGRP